MHNMICYLLQYCTLKIYIKYIFHGTYNKTTYQFFYDYLING